MVHYQLLSSYSEAEDVPYQGDALNFFRPPLIHQKQTGANKVRVVHYQLLSSYSVVERLAGAPGALIFFRLLFFHQGKKRGSEDQQVTHLIRGTYKGAYSIRPYTAGRKKNLCPSGLLFLFSFKKTYTYHQPILIKKINQCPSGLPTPIHFLNLAHHTLCFSFK